MTHDSGVDDTGWATPSFRIEMRRPRRTRYCACVFVLNEGERIRAQLARMRPFAALLDIIVADGGSTDGALDGGTLGVNDVRGVLVKTGPGRLSAQMRMALAFAMREGYDGVVVIDGNNKDDPAAIPRFIDALNSGVDHAQGSRYIPGGKAVNTPFARHVGVMLLHAPAISLAAGFRYTDTTNGFRAYSRRLLLDPRVAPFREAFVGYELHYYLAIRAARLGYSCVEIPVTRAYPAHGPTPTKISGVRGNMRVLATLARACFGHYNPRS